MSQKSFSAFTARLATDHALRDELSRALGSDGTADELVAFGRARGYEFDSGEVKRAVEELSDDDLDAVAGGTARLMKACATGKHFKDATLTS